MVAWTIPWRWRLQAGVKQLCLFHHDPDHDDKQIDGLVRHARRLVAGQQAKIASGRRARGQDDRNCRSSRFFAVVDGHGAAEQIDDAHIRQLQFPHFFRDGLLRRIMFQ